MKRFLTSIFALACTGGILGAQDVQSAAAAAAAALSNAPEAEKQVEAPKYWTESVKTNINFSQTSLNNWVAGGDNTTTMAAYIDANANWKKGVMYWNNRLQLDYGFLYASSKPIIQKNTDRIYLESKWGYQIKDKLYFSANYDFKSQFAKGYSYNAPSGVDPANEDGTYSRKQWLDARIAKSALLSPAYTNLALGIDWKPAAWFSASLAPLTGGFVISADPMFRKAYAMTLKKKYENISKDDEAYISGKAFNAARFEFGTQLKLDAKLSINDNLSYSTQLVMFSDYLNDPLDIRTNWDNRLDWKLAKYFTLTVVTNMIYDNKIDTGSDNKIQLKSNVAFGFTYTINRSR